MSQAIDSNLRLPYDILEQIFRYVCFCDPLTGPIFASQVSRSWREAALTSPCIWSNITIKLEIPPTRSQRHTLPRLHLERSQSFAIELTIYARRRFTPPEEKMLLLPHAHRFRSLHVNTDTTYLASCLWLNLEMKMPRLEMFETVVSNFSSISINRKIDTIDEEVDIIPRVKKEDKKVDWDSWKPTGLTALTLDASHLHNPPKDLDNIYRVLDASRHTIQCVEYKGLVASIDKAAASTHRRHLELPALRSLAVLGYDNMVPLLEFMIIPALDSLTLRDNPVYPIRNTSEETDLAQAQGLDELTHHVDANGLLPALQNWTSITHLEIFGVDLPFDDSDSSRPPELILSYIKSLDQLTSLVLYGIGAATTIAYTLFKHDPTKKPLLPKLSRFLLAIIEMRQEDTLWNYLNARQHHELPRLQKLSINWGYVRHLSDLCQCDISTLWNSSVDVFVFADPEVGKHIPIEEVNLLELPDSVE